MSLATRCTACGTVFRVVQDQLKVSEGWVRCGRCNEVFSALEGLFDLDRGIPSDRRVELLETPPEAASERHGRVDASMPLSATPEVAPRADPAQANPSSEEHPLGNPASADDRPDGAAASEFLDARFDSSAVAPDTALDASDPAVDSGVAQSTGPTGPTGPTADEDTGAAPEFVRHAQNQARWHRPWMRALLLFAAIGLVAALGLQAAHHFRDSVAAKFPAFGPVLAAWCDALACSIDAPRRIEDVMVESTALTRASEAEAFTLSVALRNRSTSPVAMPSIELSLTDAAGQLVARRVLQPADFRAASTVLAPGADTALQLTLTAGTAAVTGYTVEIFHP